MVCDRAGWTCRRFQPVFGAGEVGLYGALGRNEREMYYQPKVNARSGELMGANALMCWQHSVHGMISPARSIPLAEESDLISAFGAGAIDSACTQQRAWLDAGLLVVPVAGKLLGGRQPSGLD